MKSYKSLVEMRSNEEGVIVEIQGGMAVHSRLNAMGVVPGRKLRKISGSFLRGPVVLQIGNARTALGFRMAAKIIVITDQVSSP